MRSTRPRLGPWLVALIGVLVIAFVIAGLVLAGVHTTRRYDGHVTRLPGLLHK